MSLLLQSNNKLTITNRLSNRVEGANLSIDFRDNYANKNGTILTAESVVDIERSSVTAVYNLRGDVFDVAPNTLPIGSYKSSVKKGLIFYQPSAAFFQGSNAPVSQLNNVPLDSDYLNTFILKGTGSAKLYFEDGTGYVGTITQEEPLYYAHKGANKTVTTRVEITGQVEYMQILHGANFSEQLTRFSTSSGTVGQSTPASKAKIKSNVVTELLGSQMLGCLVVKIHKPRQLALDERVSEWAGKTTVPLVTTYAQITDSAGKGVYFAHYSNPSVFGGITHTLRANDSAGAENTQVVLNRLSDVETVIIAINFSKTTASAFINGTPVSTYGKPSAQIDMASTAIKDLYFGGGDETWSKSGALMIEQVVLYNRNLSIQEMSAITAV